MNEGWIGAGAGRTGVRRGGLEVDREGWIKIR
jgi:hypothetical protein